LLGMLFDAITELRVHERRNANQDQYRAHGYRHSFAHQSNHFPPRFEAFQPSAGSNPVRFSDVNGLIISSR